MENIVGRKKEIALMESLLTSKKSEFLAVYGRRRVGKTFLIREVFSERFNFQLTGANSKLSLQLNNFHRALIRQGRNENLAFASSWFDAFQQLIDVSKLPEGIYFLTSSSTKESAKITFSVIH